MIGAKQNMAFVFFEAEGNGGCLEFGHAQVWQKANRIYKSVTLWCQWSSGEELLAGGPYKFVRMVGGIGLNGVILLN